MDRIDDKYLLPTSIIDSENVMVKQKARELTENLDDTADKARALFYFVRDKIKYNPYVPKYLPEHFRASNTLSDEEGYCVQKSALLVAMARAIGVPARLGFAEIRNHLVPDKLKRWFGGDVFPWHGYAELYIDGRWVKATPVFDLQMCQENRLVPVEFDGRNDAWNFPITCVFITCRKIKNTRIGN